MKAFAIIAICFHNFFHLRNSVGENEMEFDPERIFNLFHFMTENPTLIIDALFSYFGHYGVQLFIFISGYGLTKQFLLKGIPTYKSYITRRVVKLYSLLIFGIIACLFLYTDNLYVYFKYIVFLNLTMLKTVSFKYIFFGIGPWWYFCLALQLYILFPFLYKIIAKNEKKGLYISLIISYACIYFCLPVAEKFNFPVFGNCIGHLPEFLFGIAVAAIKDFKIRTVTVALSVMVFIASNFSVYIFPFSFLTVTILLVFLIYKLIKYFPQKMTAALVFLGKISMFVFVINGPLRQISYNLFLSELSMNTQLASVFHFCFVLVVAYIMYFIYNKITAIVREKTKIPV